MIASPILKLPLSYKTYYIARKCFVDDFFLAAIKEYGLLNRRSLSCLLQAGKVFLFKSATHDAYECNSIAVFGIDVGVDFKTNPVNFFSRVDMSFFCIPAEWFRRNLYKNNPVIPLTPKLFTALPKKTGQIFPSR